MITYTEGLESLDGKLAYIGQEHGKKTPFPQWAKKIAGEYGAWYEGDGSDKLDGVTYKGSWDDKASKEIKGYPEEFLYTLFTNTKINKQKQILEHPTKSIFESALSTQDKWGYLKDRKFNSDTLMHFLKAAYMLDESKVKATKVNVNKFVDTGEGLMWPKNWEKYPNPAGKLALKASEYRIKWLLSQKEGVYFLGSDHLKTLKYASYRKLWIKTNTR